MELTKLLLQHHKLEQTQANTDILSQTQYLTNTHPDIIIPKQLMNQSLNNTISHNQNNNTPPPQHKHVSKHPTTTRHDHYYHPYPQPQHTLNTTATNNRNTEQTQRGKPAPLLPLMTKPLNNPGTITPIRHPKGPFYKPKR